MTSTDPKRRLLIMRSTAREDVDLTAALIASLHALAPATEITVWSPERSERGEDRARESEPAIDDIDVVVLLLSPDFLASGALVGRSRRIKQRASRALRVIPILLRACTWRSHAWLQRLHPLPADHVAIKSRSGAALEPTLRKVAREIVAPALKIPTAQSMSLASSTPWAIGAARPGIPVPSADMDVDFAIFTTLEEERSAICAALGLGLDDRIISTRGHVYWRGRLPLPNGEHYEVVVASPIVMGQRQEVLLALDVLREWRPHAAIVVGIAASADRNVKLGDVVVGRTIHYHEHGKSASDNVNPELGFADAALMYAAARLEWEGPFRSHPDGSEVTLRKHLGTIASGEKLLPIVAARNPIAARAREILAVATESSDVSLALSRSLGAVKQLEIRGISVARSGAKDAIKHRYAAAAAANFTRFFLLSRPLVPLSSANLNWAGRHPVLRINTSPTAAIPGGLESVMTEEEVPIDAELIDANTTPGRLENAEPVPADLASAPPTSSLCLNVWFDAGVTVLHAREGSLLHVNLGLPRAVGESVSDPLSPETRAVLYEVPAVDVLVTCATADVMPIVQRLPLPPDPERVLTWTIVPLRAGPMRLQIALLIMNEPVHRTVFDIEAIERQADPAIAREAR